MNKPAYILTTNTVTVLLDTKAYTIADSHINFQAVKNALIEGRYEDLESLMSIKEAVAKWSNGIYTITEEGVFYDKKRVPAALESRIMAFLDEGLPFEPLLNFYQRLQANPSFRAVNELYTFLEHKNIPIDADGFFYAYKAIRENWFDKYTGTINNSIGQKPSMPRHAVDDDCNQHCSQGLHVGALEYVAWYGNGSTDRCVIVKVDPADVVSVPLDHNCQKVRVSTYEVIAEYTGPMPETLYRVAAQDTDDLDEYNEFDDSWDDEEEEEEDEYEDLENPEDNDDLNDLDDPDDLSTISQEELEDEEAAASDVCLTCGYEFDSELSYAFCPDCGSKQ